MAKKRPRVFLSHSHKDKEFVRQFEASLISVGVNTFLDEKEISIGDSIPESIYEGIRLSTHLAYIISQNSIKSKWVLEELKYRENQRKRIFWI